MFRKFLEVRCFAYALIALALTVCAVEIGLQVRATRYGCTLTPAAGQLTVASWQTHHQLRPNSKTLVKNPDTNSPIEIRTNSFGLRGAEPIVPKPTDVYRIICLGDETVFAGEVGESDSVTQRLQGFLQNRTQRKIEVINAGVPGFCPLLSCIQLRTSLASLNPDLVVLNFDMTDIADDHRYRRYTETGQNDEPIACTHTSLLSDRRPQSATLLDQFHLSTLAKNYIGDVMNERSTLVTTDIESPKATWKWTANEPPDWSIYIRHALEPIIHLQHQARGMGTEFLFSCTPAPWQISATAGNDTLRKSCGVPVGIRYANRGPFQLLTSVAEKYHIRFLEPSNAFLQISEPDRLFHQSNRNLSRYGHALLAHELAEFIVQQIPGILSDSPESGSPIFHQATNRRETDRVR